MKGDKGDDLKVEGYDCVLEEGVGRRREALSKFWMNSTITENMLIKKARLKWLNDGDSNCKCFHSIMKERRHSNFVGSINTAKGIADYVKEVKEEV